MTSTTKRSKSDRAPPVIDMEALVGPLTAALAPQITKLVEAEFEKRAASFQAIGNKSKNLDEGGGNDTSPTGGSDEGLAKNDSDSGPGLKSRNDDELEQSPCGDARESSLRKAELSIQSPGGSKKRKLIDLDEEHEQGELSDTTEEDRVMDPLDIYLESKLTWTVPKETGRYLQAYTKRALSKDERRAMVDSFPKPADVSVAMPRVDDAFLNLLRQQSVQLK